MRTYFLAYITTMANETTFVLFVAMYSATLLKYVYRCMEKAGQNYASLLKWHERIVEKDGPGAIMRVLVDRNF